MHATPTAIAPARRQLRLPEFSEKFPEQLTPPPVRLPALSVGALARRGQPPTCCAAKTSKASKISDVFFKLHTYSKEFTKSKISESCIQDVSRILISPIRFRFLRSPELKEIDAIQYIQNPLTKFEWSWSFFFARKLGSQGHVGLLLPFAVNMSKLPLFIGARTAGKLELPSACVRRGHRIEVADPAPARSKMGL